MSEVWQNIEGYDDYQVSNYGRVKSLKFGKERILKPKKESNGYLRVGLYKDRKIKFHSVHRLVAQTFLKPVVGKDCVNHLDEDKTNNHVENLEWCTYKENLNYGTRNARATKTMTNGKQSKSVVGISPISGEVVVEFPSTKEAGRNGYHSGHVSDCCLGKYKTHKGLIWRYK